MPNERMISADKLANMIEEAKKLDAEDKTYEYIGKKLRVSRTAAYCMANGCANSREFERKVKEKGQEYSLRISKHLDEIPLTGYDVGKKPENSKRSLIVRFARKETDLTKEGIIRDFNYTLRKCEEAIGAKQFDIKLAYKDRKLKLTPKGIEAKAFLKPFVELVLPRKIKE